MGRKCWAWICGFAFTEELDFVEGCDFVRPVGRAPFTAPLCLVLSFFDPGVDWSFWRLVFPIVSPLILMCDLLLRLSYELCCCFDLDSTPFSRDE